MLELTPDEARVLGVLIEKAQTTPEQYPLSVNAIMNGANQKNNRDPVITMDEGRAYEAVEGLRTKGLAIRVDQANSRVHKYRHNTVDVLRIRTGEMAILAELLLRGPQTLGELRGRASRMHPLESIDAVKDLLRALTDRPEPLVRQIAPSPGTRAERYQQLLSPEPSVEHETTQATPTARNDSTLVARVEQLEKQVDELRAIVQRLATSLGESDSIPTSTDSEPRP